MLFYSIFQLESSSLEGVKYLLMNYLIELSTFFVTFLEHKHATKKYRTFHS